MSDASATTKNHVLYLVTHEGHCQSVQLSMELWAVVEKQVLSAVEKLTADEDPFSKEQPLDKLAELKTYWDFHYPYEAHVHCDNCHASTDSWEDDPLHPFHLTNANFAGLLVFRCRCGATVRKKHFHKKSVLECSPPSAKGQNR